MISTIDKTENGAYSGRMKQIIVSDEAHRVAKIEAAKHSTTMGEWVASLIFAAAKQDIKPITVK